MEKLLKQIKKNCGKLGKTTVTKVKSTVTKGITTVTNKKTTVSKG
jgi:hypothetical protein